MKNFAQLLLFCFLVAAMAYASTAANYNADLTPTNIDTTLFMADDEEESLKLEPWMFEFGTINSNI